MSAIAIQAQGLAKQYRIGERERYKSLRDSLMRIMTAPAPQIASFLRPSRARTPVRDNTIWALRDISLEVRRGEVLGIIGRNGAGKSTLLKILSRITEPTCGYVDVWGRVGSLLEVGTGFHPELTGRENIYLNGAILGMTRHEISRRFDAIVAFAEIDDFLDTPVKRYSSGMFMRLAFAVAAHLEPDILLVDEVLSVGDVAFQKKCLGRMNSLTREGRTILFVSHNLAAISDLCSSCILMDEGRIARVGRTDHVLRAYFSASSPSGGSFCFEQRTSDAFFTSLILRNQLGLPRAAFSLSEPIVVAMQLVVRRPIRGLQASIAPFNYKGERIFYHSSAYATPTILLEQPGTYALEVQLPARFFLPGSYCLNLGLHVPGIELFDLREHVAPFEIEDTDSKRHDFPPQLCGSVFVDLSWKCQSSGFIE